MANPASWDSATWDKSTWQGDTPPAQWDTTVWDQSTWVQADLAGQVLTAAPFNDGITTTFPEYGAVGTTGYMSLDPAQQMEGGIQ